MSKKHNKELKKFMETPFKAKAQVLDKRIVEVQAQDGEIFQVISDVGKYLDRQTITYQLHLIEYIFDKNFSEDKEIMSSMIWRDLRLMGVNFLGMSAGNRVGERIRIGSQIRKLREAIGMEAKDLALLACIDPANLSRIEQGKYSVGIDILSRIAFVLGAHIELVSNDI